MSMPLPVVPWALRVVWVVQPLAFVPLLSDATGSVGRSGTLLIGITCWALWAIGLLASFVPSTVALTAGRLIAPTSIAVVAVCALGPDVAVWSTALGAAASALAVLIWFSGETGALFAQGSAYGDEQRFPLKAPVPYVVPMVVSWLVVAGSAVTGVVLVANDVRLVGSALGALGVAGSWFIAPRFHLLSRRWLVIVPVGVVVHDPMLLMENALFRSNELSALHLAPAATAAADITGGTAGVAVEIVLGESVTIIKAARDHPTGVALHVLSVMVAPTRPGAALRAAMGRGLPVG
ncbi:MAG: hypothetical protein ABIW84_07590 [Ilumatobacteraceae bacterium]